MTKVKEEKLVRLVIDKDDILIRAGDPSFSTKEIDKEILQIIKDGGQVKNVTYKEYMGMKLYTKIKTH